MFDSFYLKELNTAVFDIETTGLLHSRDCIINSGFCGPEEELWQNFTESPADEKRVAAEAVERLSSLEAVITYNGDSFDLPFLLARAKKYGIAEKLPAVWSVDLYRLLKKYWPVARTMPSLSQKSVEKALGLEELRTDAIPGGDCIGLYNYYLQTKDEQAKDKILLHNADDVRQLARIAKKCSFLPYHAIAFNEGFLFRAGELRVLVKGSRFGKGILAASAVTDSGMLPISVYDDCLHLEYDMFSGSAEIEIRTSKAEDYSYVDLSRLPVDKDAFSGTDAVHSGYLVLETGGELDFRAANLLIREVLSAYMRV